MLQEKSTVILRKGHRLDLQETLKHYFGYDSLRSGQQELIDGILAGRDVLGIMPTEPVSRFVISCRLC